MSRNILEENEPSSKAKIHTSQQAKKRLQKRYTKEKRFKLIGLCAVLVAGMFLAVLLATIIADAIPVLRQHSVTVTVPLNAEEIDPEGKRTAASVSGANYGGLVKDFMREKFPNVTSRREKKALYGIISSSANLTIQEQVMANPQLVGKPLQSEVLLSDYADQFVFCDCADLRGCLRPGPPSRVWFLFHVSRFIPLRSSGLSDRRAISLLAPSGRKCAGRVAAW